MKFKLLRRRLSISAPKMTVRTHRPWPVRAGIVAGLIVLLVVAAGLAFEAGRRNAGFDRNLVGERDALRGQLTEALADRERMSSLANAAQSRLDIEKTAQDELGRQIKSLEMENAKLKDDVGFFEGLSSVAGISGVAIKRFAVDRDVVPSQLRYRLLLATSAEHVFSGGIQLIATVQQGGKTVIMNLPEGPQEAGKGYPVSFRLFKRIEGTFRIPPGSTITKVEARIVEGGAVRAQQSVMVN